MKELAVLTSRKICNLVELERPCNGESQKLIPSCEQRGNS